MHEAYGNLDEVMAAFFPKVSELGYTKAFEEFYVPKFWTDVDSTQYTELAKNREYSEGIVELMDYLKKNNFYTVIVSTGPYQLAQRAQKDLGIEKYTPVR